jgi:RimJ/RimL family protein N-acetyltransferase
MKGMLNKETLPTIHSDRVSLRWLTAADVRSLYAIFSNPEVMRYWSSPPMQQVAEAEALLAHIHECFARQSLFQWGVVIDHDEKLIGTCTLSHLDAENRRAEVGFALGREHWGFGYMHEALSALIGFAFGELKLHRLEADVDPRNTRSIRLLERFGFQREGFLRERWLVAGGVQDTAFYGLLRREWQAGG